MGVHALMLTDAFLYLGDQVEPASGGGTGDGTTGGGAVLLSDLFFSLGDMTGAASGGGTVDPPADPCKPLVLEDEDGEIVLKVAADPYQKGYGDRGPWRRIRYKSTWGESDRAIDLLRGGIPAVVGGVITFPTPHRYPGNPNIICMNAVGTPIGPARPDSKLYAAESCWIDADYEVPQLDVYGEQFQEEFDGDQIPWASISERPAEEMVPINVLDVNSTPRFRYVGGPDGLAPMSGQIGLPVAGTIVEIRRGMIPGTLSPGLLALLKSLNGKLNHAAFCGYARGTLRLENWSRDFRYDASGKVVWEYGINFRYRQVDHNSEIVDGTLDQWANIETPSGGRRFQYADMRPLKVYGVI